jgi:hypothetical protein
MPPDIIGVLFQQLTNLTPGRSSMISSCLQGNSEVTIFTDACDFHEATNPNFRVPQKKHIAIWRARQILYE